MNAEQWQVRIQEVGFVKATKELVGANMTDEPVTKDELKELWKRIEKLEKK